MNKQTLVFLELLTEPKSVGRVLSIRIKLYISIPKLNNWPWVLFNQYLNRSNLLLWLLTWWTHECLNNPVQPKNIHFVFNLIWISDNVAIVLTLMHLLVIFFPFSPFYNFRLLEVFPMFLLQYSCGPSWCWPYHAWSCLPKNIFNHWTNRSMYTRGIMEW